MNVVDSSGWLEYLGGTAGAEFFAAAIEGTARLIVPTVCLYEVTKVIRRQRGAQMADEAAALMTQGQVIDLTTQLALMAATYSLPLADSIIYATAQAHHATLWTQDVHLKDLAGVRFQVKA